MLRGRRSLSNSPSSYSSTQSSPVSSAEDAADQTELEAAEVLKDLAQLATREKAAKPNATWGSKRKRLKKIVNSESPLNDSQLIQDPVVQDQQHAQAIFKITTIKPAKAEQDGDSSRPSLLCAPRKSPAGGGGGRGRRNLTEAEKEERRIRRVLANRESARQTIRRRQVI